MIVTTASALVRDTFEEPLADMHQLRSEASPAGSAVALFVLDFAPFAEPSYDYITPEEIDADHV
jgi:hypothetical protein